MEDGSSQCSHFITLALLSDTRISSKYHQSLLMSLNLKREKTVPQCVAWRQLLASVQLLRAGSGYEEAMEWKGCLVGCSVQASLQGKGFGDWTAGHKGWDYGPVHQQAHHHCGGSPRKQLSEITDVSGTDLSRGQAGSTEQAQRKLVLFCLVIRLLRLYGWKSVLSRMTTTVWYISLACQNTNQFQSISTPEMAASRNSIFP